MIRKYNEPILMPILLARHKCGQGHETVEFGGQEVKCQGYMRTKIDVEASFSTPSG